MNNDKTAIIKELLSVARDTEGKELSVNVARYIAGSGNPTGATLENACKVFLNGHQEQLIKIVEDLERLPNSERAKEYLVKLKPFLPNDEQDQEKSEITKPIVAETKVAPEEEKAEAPTVEENISSGVQENAENKKSETEPAPTSVNKETVSPVADTNNAPEEEQATLAAVEATQKDAVPAKCAELEYHELANMFPMIEGEYFERLREDIQNHGQQEPIRLYEGKIIDGRNRYKACLKLNIEPNVEEYTGDSPVSYILSLNLHRRHLTSSQLAAYLVDVLPRLEEEAKERRQSRLKQNTVTEKIPEREQGEARKIAAENFPGTNARYISDAKRIKAKRPEEFEAIKAGDKKISKVVREMKEDSQTDSAASEPTQTNESTVAFTKVTLSSDLFGKILELISSAFGAKLESILALKPTGAAKLLIEKRLEEMKQELESDKPRALPGTIPKAG